MRPHGARLHLNWSHQPLQPVPSTRSENRALEQQVACGRATGLDPRARPLCCSGIPVCEGSRPTSGSGVDEKTGPSLWFTGRREVPVGGQGSRGHRPKEARLSRPPLAPGDTKYSSHSYGWRVGLAVGTRPHRSLASMLCGDLTGNVGRATGLHLDCRLHRPACPPPYWELQENSEYWVQSARALGTVLWAARVMAASPQGEWLLWKALAFWGVLSLHLC